MMGNHLTTMANYALISGEVLAISLFIKYQNAQLLLWRAEKLNGRVTEEISGFIP